MRTMRNDDLRITIFSADEEVYSYKGFAEYTNLENSLDKDIKSS
jgi:hypothetical protein